LTGLFWDAVDSFAGLFDRFCYIFTGKSTSKADKFDNLHSMKIIYTPLTQGSPEIHNKRPEQEQNLQTKKVSISRPWRMSALQCVVVRCSALQCVAVRCSTLQYVAVRCSALQCAAVRCSALQCVAVRCSALCCSALQRNPLQTRLRHLRLLPRHTHQKPLNMSSCVAVCCSVLQCVAVCCSVLQCVAMCCASDASIHELLHLHTRAWTYCFNILVQLHHTAPHCTIPHYTTPHCTMLHNIATHCHILHHTPTHTHKSLQNPCHTHLAATHHTTLHHTAPHCNTLTNLLKIPVNPFQMRHAAPHCNTLYHTATNCNTLQHTKNLFEILIILSLRIRVIPPRATLYISQIQIF